MAFMTKKHFDFLANAIGPLRYELSGCDFRLVVDDLADQLLTTNDNFDIVQFKYACGLTEEIETDDMFHGGVYET